MAQADRPLSPHLQVYRPQITSTLSILHRITGVGLALGTLLLAYWLIAAASGADAFASAQALVGSWLGMLVLFAWSVALFYHLCNGIRHLFWDAGLGLEIASVYRSGWTVLIVTAILTIVAWAIGLTVMGAA